MTVLEQQTPFALQACWTDRRIAAVSTDADFERFFLQQYDRLVRSLAAITGDHELANDCVQEAFIRSYARWNRIRRYDNPATWVRRVAINLSRDAARSDQRRRRREDRVESRSLPEPPGPAELVNSSLDLVQVLQQLSPQQRTVAALFYVEDLSIADIAASLGLTKGAVKFHLNKARANLKEPFEMREV